MALEHILAYKDDVIFVTLHDFGEFYKQCQQFNCYAHQVGKGESFRYNNLVQVFKLCHDFFGCT